jgi:hypothetical protein
MNLSRERPATELTSLISRRSREKRLGPSSNPCADYIERVIAYLVPEKFDAAADETV